MKLIYCPVSAVKKGKEALHEAEQGLGRDSTKLLRLQPGGEDIPLGPPLGSNSQFWRITRNSQLFLYSYFSTLYGI